MISTNKSAHTSNCSIIYSIWWMTTLQLVVCVHPLPVKMDCQFMDMPSWHYFINTVNSKKLPMNFHTTRLFHIKKFSNSSYLTIGWNVLQRNHCYITCLILRPATHLSQNMRNAKNKKCIAGYFAPLFSRFAHLFSLFAFCTRVKIRAKTERIL